MERVNKEGEKRSFSMEKDVVYSCVQYTELYNGNTDLYIRHTCNWQP